MEIDREALLRTFLSDAGDYLTGIEESVLAVEKGGYDQELLQTAFRMAHSLKGDAWTVGLEALTRVAHAVEAIIEQLWNQTLPVTPTRITLLLRAVDSMRGLIQDVDVAGEEPGPEEQALIADIEAESGESAEKWSAHDSFEVPKELAPEKTSSTQGRGGTMRVETGKLDRLLNLTGQIVIARDRLRQILEERQNVGRREALEVHREADRLYLELQETVMRLRMVPVGPLFRQFQRVVRDTASEHGKETRLVLEGEQVEVDTAVVEHLKEPLTHVVRNSIAHGIERGDVRKQAGKDPCGTVWLKARHDAGCVVVEVCDDGRGFDRERIAKRARELDLIAEGTQLTDAQAHELVFEPGFSTAEGVSHLAGRGIGMDAVRRAVEGLRGNVELSSEPGRGSTVTLRLPLTLAMIEAFLVAVGDETCIMPMEAVVECLAMPKDLASAGGVRGVLAVRGQPLPLFRMRSLFQLDGPPPERESVVVVQHLGTRVGLVVDTLLGTNQTVIKPLGRAFRDLPAGFSSSAILGNGRVALILDVGRAVRLAATDDRAGEAPAVTGV